MPFVVKHKSHDVCYVRYVKNNRYQGQLIFDLAMLALGIVLISIIILTLGTSFVLLIPLLLISNFWVMWSKLGTADDSSEFEIELNRALGLVFVRNRRHANLKPTTYSFGTFKGFGFRRTPFTRKSKSLFQAELHFNMEPIRGMRRITPLRNQTYLVAPENAQAIVDEIDEWLGLIETDNVDEPEQEKEILRDFRELAEPREKNAL